MELIGYLLFFPVLTVGPILRSKQYFDRTEQIRFSPDCFCFGVRRYMLGYIKRLAVAAIFLRAMSELMLYANEDVPLLSFLIVLIFSFLGFYFAISGTTDLAVGVCAMYGIAIPHDRARLSRATTPDRVIYGLLPSLHSYISDYLITPLLGHTGKKGGRLCAALLFFVATVLAWRTRPEMLLFALPLLVFALLERLPRVCRFVFSGSSSPSCSARPSR